MGDTRSTVIPPAQISTGFFGECCQSHSESSLEGVSVRQKGVKPNREREREREWEIGLGQADIFGYIDCNESVSMHDQGTDLPAIPGSKS